MKESLTHPKLTHMAMGTEELPKTEVPIKDVSSATKGEQSKGLEPTAIKDQEEHEDEAGDQDQTEPQPSQPNQSNEPDSDWTPGIKFDKD